MIKSNYNIVAVMSGTSLDGVDIIYASYHYNASWNYEIHHSETLKYSSDWKVTLSELVNTSKEELQEMDMIYSKYLAELILEFIERNKIEYLDFIASHGHTALHRPEEGLTLSNWKPTIIGRCIT